MLKLFASRKTAIVLLIAAFTLSLVKAQIGWGGNYPLIALLGLLSINLITCLSLNAQRIWRRSPALLAFHIGLIGVSLFGLVSALTYFHGYFQLTENQSIHNEFQFPEKGPLYKDRLQGFELLLNESRVAFHERRLGIKRDEQLVTVHRPDGLVSDDILRFNEPLLYGNYRYYLAMDMGFAVVFSFTDHAGSTRPGVVFLPDYVVNPALQTENFYLPGSKSQVAMSLDPRALPFDAKRAWALDLPSDARIKLAYTASGKRQRVTMKPGEKVKIAGGTLNFESVRRWHGFLVDYDPSRPFLAFSVLLAFLGLTWHYAAIVLKPSKGRSGDRNGSKRPGTITMRPLPRRRLETEDPAEAEETETLQRSSRR